MRTILEQGEQEGEKGFGVQVDFSRLVENVQIYKEEIQTISASGKGMILRSLLRKLHNTENKINAGDTFSAFGDTKRAIRMYSQIKKGESGFSQAQKRMIEIGMQNPKLFLEISQYIQEISIGNGEFVFQKGYTYSFINFSLQDIGIRRDSYLADSDERYVVSLSQNENGMQEEKLSFLCIPYHSIDDGSFDGVYAKLEDLDILLHPKTIIFQGIDAKGAILFSEKGKKVKIRFSGDRVLHGLRKKDIYYEDDKTEAVIVWEEGSENISIILDPSNNSI